MEYKQCQSWMITTRYYDVEVGKGPEATEGNRVAVHYDAYWKGITFMTSRQVDS